MNFHEIKQNLQNSQNLISAKNWFPEGTSFAGFFIFHDFYVLYLAIESCR